MPPFYLDASAITKLYLPGERGVDFVVQLLESQFPDDRFFTSGLSIVEVKSAISRRIDSLTDRAELLAMYDYDVHEVFEILPVSDDIIIRAGAVTEDYRLRAGDAIHLATALSIAATVDDSQVFMVSSDVELLEASEAAGIGALDPQVDDATGSLRQIRE